MHGRLYYEHFHYFLCTLKKKSGERSTIRHSVSLEIYCDSTVIKQAMLAVLAIR